MQVTQRERNEKGARRGRRRKRDKIQSKVEIKISKLEDR
jgi:hypothetical protein